MTDPHKCIARMTDTHTCIAPTNGTPSTESTTANLAQLGDQHNQKQRIAAGRARQNPIALLFGEFLSPQSLHLARVADQGRGAGGYRGGGRQRTLPRDLSWSSMICSSVARGSVVISTVAQWRGSILSYSTVVTTNYV